MRKQTEDKVTFSSWWNQTKSLVGLGGNSAPNYAKLSDGTHSYHYESFYDTSLHGMLDFVLGKRYFKPLNNYKEYYIRVPYLNTVVNKIASFTSSVEIKEVTISTGKEIENSLYKDLLNHPNNWQTKEEFISEMTVNMLICGAIIQYGTYFQNGNLKQGASLHNIEPYYLAYPKVKNPYTLSRREQTRLEYIEYIDGIYRRLKGYELNIVYDT